jgi:hypothetical protein
LLCVDRSIPLLPPRFVSGISYLQSLHSTHRQDRSPYRLVASTFQTGKPHAPQSSVNVKKKKLKPIKHGHIQQASAISTHPNPCERLQTTNNLLPSRSNLSSTSKSNITLLAASLCNVLAVRVWKALSASCDEPQWLAHAASLTIRAYGVDLAERTGVPKNHRLILHLGVMARVSDKQTSMFVTICSFVWANQRPVFVCL